MFGFRSLANMKENDSANYLTLQLNPVIDHCCSMFWVIVIDFYLILNGKFASSLYNFKNQPLRGRLHKAAARPQRRGERLGALKFKEPEKLIDSIKQYWNYYI